MWQGYGRNMVAVTAARSKRTACADVSLSWWCEMLHCGAEHLYIFHLLFLQRKVAKYISHFC
jgi:hypothetical protein